MATVRDKRYRRGVDGERATKKKNWKDMQTENEIKENKKRRD